MKKSKLTGKQVDILRSAVLFTMTRRGWSGRCKVSKQTVDEKFTVESSTARLGVSKQLISCPEFDAIWECLGKAYAWCLDHSMPGTDLRKGFYFVKRTAVIDGKPTDMVQLFDSKIAQFNSTIQNELVPAFLAVYPSAKAEAKKSKKQGGLGELFNNDDYPTAAELRTAFCIEHMWVQLSVPGELPEEIAKRENAKLQQAFDNARTDMQAALRQGFKSLVDEAVHRLGGSGEFTGKKFREDSLNGFKHFLETFSAKDITGDTELAGLVKQMQGLMAGMPEAKDIRNDTAVQTVVQNAFNEVKQKLDWMVIVKPRRKLIVED